MTDRQEYEPICKWQGFYEDGRYYWLISCNKLQTPRQRWHTETAIKCGHCQKRAALILADWQ